MKTYIIAGMVGLVALLGSTAEAEGPTLQDEAETLQHLATSPTLTADEQAQLAEMARLAIAIDKRMAELNSTGTRADSDPEFLRLEAELLTLRDRRLTDINNKMLAIFRHRAKGVEAKGQDGDAIRRECEDNFKAAADEYRANTNSLRGAKARVAVAQKEREILDYIPECWR